MALAETMKLTKYFGGLAAVNELDLLVHEGEIVGLIGPNGAGKTTVFNLISGVVHPTRGRITFKGEDTTHLSPNRIAEKGLVRTFQLTSLFSKMTVLENVILACYLQSKTGFWKGLFSSAEFRTEEGRLFKEAMRLLEFIGLQDLKDQVVKNLTHGYQRRLGVAMALGANPKLLMLDEPLSGMSADETSRMLALFEAIRRKEITILIIEHNMRAIMSICDRIVVLDQGRKIAEGPPRDIQKSTAVIKAYLGGGEVAA